MTGGAASRLALRELRGGLRGFRIFVACLAIGVAAVAAVGTTASAIRAGIEADGRQTLGGDISIRSLHRDISEEQRAWLDASGEVSRSMRMRAMTRTADRSARSLIELKAVDSAYPLYGRLALDPEGAPRPSPTRRVGSPRNPHLRSRGFPSGLRKTYVMRARAQPP